MRFSLSVAAGLLAAMQAWTQSAAAATNTYVCAVSEVQECRANNACKRVTPQEINLAPIVELDVKKKELVSVSIADKGRKEAIEGVKVTDKHVFLYGLQDKETWSGVISLETGRITASVSAVDGGYVMFGNCAPK